MQYITGKSVNELVYKSIKEIVNNGHVTESRNGQITTLYDVEMILENPKARHLQLNGRKNNIFATIAEMFWVMAGEQKINPYLSFFLPRANDFSDDSENWYAAYGARMYEYDGIQNVLDIFKNEGIYSRRAVIGIYHPEKDTKQSLYNILGTIENKDTPCNNWINFFITPDKKLNMKVVQRSGDIIWGTGNINLPEFALLQEYILSQLVEHVDSELTLGYYHHSVTNLHLYDFTSSQAVQVLTTPQEYSTYNDDNIIFPKVDNIECSSRETRKFFKDLIDRFGLLIEFDHSFDISKFTSYINEIFDNYNVEKDNNVLYVYAQCILYYICKKKYQIEYKVDLDGYSKELVDAIEKNSFR